MQSTKAKVESYPAPPQLATKTDLSPQEVKAVTEAVNPLIADAFALYVKTKNFHWHLYGSHFRDYHLKQDFNVLEKCHAQLMSWTCAHTQVTPMSPIRAV